ncbi:hypothetical protein [Natronobiforma cellulositropha]|uniref:hypothetical protein n=1 Tax=Natronobiforma cellulositropha TaxID=1679076 RepID=UPI0021D5EC88|nr:hypothetical protein [Natronobiforma cellulositropha]
METVKTIDPRVKSAILWGAVGFMSFLVSLQAYALLEGPLLSLPQGAAIGLLVGVAAGGCAYALEYRVAAWAARRATE